MGYKFLALQKYFIAPHSYQQKLRVLHRRYARLFLEKAKKLKGAMIKVGQFISTRVDVMPLEYTETLSELQDSVPPVSVDVIRQRIVAELEREPEEVFAEFSPTPIASASLGQVHEARLRNGQRVAVKVQYPDIDRIIEMDLKALKLALWLLKRHLRHIDFQPVFEEFSRFLREELDYIHEAHNAERFLKNFAGSKDIIIPRVIWDYTTRKVLTLEFLEGKRITDYIAESSDPELRSKVAYILCDSFVKQIFVHQFFHGDPHPGNILVQDSGRVALLDFGLCKELPPEVTTALKHYATAVVAYDADGVARAAREIALIYSPEDQRRLRDVVSKIFTHFGQMSPKEFKNARIVSTVGNMLHDFFSEARTLRIPNDLIVLSRTTGILEGLAAQLDPSVNLIQMSKPHIKRYLREEDSSLRSLLGNLREILTALITLPNLMKEYYSRANAGSLESRMEVSNLESAGDKVLQASRLLALSILLGISASVYVLCSWRGNVVGEAVSAGIGFGVFLLFLRNFFRST